MDSAEASQIAAAAAREARRGPGPLADPPERGGAAVREPREAVLSGETRPAPSITLADLLAGLDVGGDANAVTLYTGRRAGRQSVAKYIGKTPAPRDSHFTYGPARLYMTYHHIPIPTTTRVPRDV